MDNRRPWVLGLCLLVACKSTPQEAIATPPAEVKTEKSQPAQTHQAPTSICPEIGEGKPVSPLRMKAVAGSREVSKDSHSSSRTASFDGRVLTLRGPYGKCVRGRCRHAEGQMLLLETEIAELSAELDRRGLWTSMKEVHELQPASPSSSSHATLELSEGKRSAKTEVLFGRWRTKGKSEEVGSTDAIGRQQDIRQLLEALQVRMLRCYPDLKVIY